MKGKKKKYKSSYGAVTVFLTLILLPCMIFVCAFGDVSRVELSKTQASGAADLSLYALMSNYDKDLEDWYGLMASCQSINGFYDDCADYFIGMMTASGMEDSASDELLSYFASLQSGDFTDFLQIEQTEEVTASAVSNSSLGENPALIEDGIVEFMKYRGPIEIVTNLYDRLSNSNILTDLQEADENEPIREAKQEYAEAEADMTKDAFHTYLAIQKYVEYQQENDVPSTSANGFSTYAKHLELIRNDLTDVTRLITLYYADTDGIADQSSRFTNLSLPTLNNDDPTDPYVYYNWIYYDMEDIGATDNDGVFTMTADDIKNLISQAQTYRGYVENNAAAVKNALSGLQSPNDSSDVNPAIYCMKFQNAVSGNNLDKVKTYGVELMKQYARLLLCAQCSFEDGTSEEVQTEVSQALSDEIAAIESVQKNYLSFKYPSSNYENALYDYYETANTNKTVNKVKNRSYKFTSEYVEALGYNSSVTINQFFQYVRQEFDGLTDELQTQIDNLNVAIKGGKFKYDGETYKAVSLDKLGEEIEEYITKRDAWGDEAGSHSTEYAQDESDEYKNGETDKFAKYLAEAGAESTNQLKTRLTNIKNLMQDLLDALKGFKYGGSVVSSMTESSAIKAAKKTIEDVGISISSEKSKAENTYAPKLIKPASGTSVYSVPSIKNGKTGNNPDLAQNPPDLYAAMREYFKDEDLDDLAEQEDAWEGRKDSAEEDAGNQENASKEVGNEYIEGHGSDLTNVSSGSSIFNFVTIIDSLATSVQNIVNGNFGEELRDEIYVCEYIMDMFTYSTYNNEGRYNIAKEAGVTITSDEFAKLSNYDTQWTPIKTSDGYDATDYYKYHNLSLTNKAMNADTHQANLAEVEYILFGNTSYTTNLQSSYNTIFTIRAALNLISGFVNFYSGSNTTANTISLIANITQGLTHGIIPAALVKVVLIGVLATMESAKDMQRLKAGTPVVLYKGDDKEWFYALSGGDPSGEFGSTSNPEPDDSDDGLYYSDYMYFFLLMVASSSSYSTMLSRVGDLVEANMAKVTGESYDLNNSVCYFKLSGTLKVKPLLLTLPLASSMKSDGVDTSVLLENTDWCTYTVSVIRGYS